MENKTSYIRTLTTVDVYNSFELDGFIMKTIPANEMVPYNREKRRNRQNWMEIYLPDNTVAYVKKNTDEIFICTSVKLGDKSANGFYYTVKGGNNNLPLAALFLPVKLSKSGHPIHAPEPGMERVTLNRIENSDKKKEEILVLEFDPTLVEVEKYTFRKKEVFYIIYDSISRKEPFKEVDNLKGKRAYLLRRTSTDTAGDEWMGIVAGIIAVATVLAIIIGFLATGWLVISGLMIIPAIIVAAIAIIVIQIPLMILIGIFKQIRKRF